MARKFLYFIAFCVFLLLAGFTALSLFPQQAAEIAFVPQGKFVEQDEVEQSVYADVGMWYARPDITENNPSLWTPEGFEPGADNKAAVFFVHPTSYLTRANWNAPLDDEPSQKRARIFIRSQASVFNGVADVWAPRYRQATLGAFITDKPEGKQALDAAYLDVQTAFEEFLAEIPKDQPIILAGHSQGSLHLTYLLQNFVKGKPLAKRIIGVYIVGWPVSVKNDLDAMGLPACDAPEQTGCIISWQSYAEPADTSLVTRAYDLTIGFDGEPRKGKRMLCTNPLTGTIDAEAPKEENIGTLVPNEDLTDGEIVADAVPARCDDRGFLLIGDPPDLGSYVLPGENYHVYDYPLFWANARADIERRVSAFLAR